MSARATASGRRSGSGPRLALVAALSVLSVLSVLGGLLLAVPGAARELYRGDDVVLEFSGSLRGFGVVGSGTDTDAFEDAVRDAALASPPGLEIQCISAAVFADCPAFDVMGEKRIYSLSARLRGQLDLQVGSAWSAQVAYDHRMRGGTLDTFEAQLGEGLAPANLMANSWNIVDEPDFDWDHRFYRMWLRGETEHLEATVGRQRLAWGTGRLWNPIDRLAAVEPLAVQPDEIVGVDAVDARWRFTGFTFVEAVYAPGGSRDEMSAALRLHGVLRDVDYSIVAGSFEQAWTGGIDLSANLKDAAIRAEVVYTDPSKDVWRVGAPAPRELAPFWQIVVGADYLFPLGTGLYALVEHLYNGNALGFGSGRAGPRLNFFESTLVPPDPAIPEVFGPFVRPADRDIFGTSRVVSASLHQTGFQLGYDVTPALSANFLTIVDWNGGSAAFFPTLRYTGFNAVEITVGVQAFVGPLLSEFGSAEPFGFVLVDWFF